jgi:hypothetical protein
MSIITGSHPNRRAVLAGAAALPAGLALPGLAHANDAPATLAYRGVVYDTGTDIGYEGYLSRLSWHEEDVRREIATIAKQLHCTAIQIVGTELPRLELASRIASEHGLQIWLQPRLFEQDGQTQLSHMAEGAKLAARLADEGRNIVFSVGCETSLFQRDMVPGDTFSERLGPLFSATGDDAAAITARLNTYLASAVATASAHFSGPLTYSAGSWERVDWTPFDLVGINLYRDRNNREAYRDILRGHMGQGKPTIITEFGSCTFEGAGDYGAGGFQIVDYATQPPTIPERFVRSEQTQAREIGELLAIFAEEGVAGAFVYNFLAQFDVHSDEPRHDLDTASHAIVKVMPGAADAPLVWEPKQAFDVIAEIYGDHAE